MRRICLGLLALVLASCPSPSARPLQGEHYDCISDDDCALGFHCDTDNTCFRWTYVHSAGPRCSAQLLCPADQRCSPASERCVTCSADQCQESRVELEEGSAIYNDVWVTGTRAFAVGKTSYTADDGELRTLSLVYPEGSGDLLKGELFSVRGRSASDVWAVGQAGIIRHYDGSAWRAFPGGNSLSDLRDLWFDESGVLWVVGLNNTVFRLRVPENMIIPTPPPPDARDWYGISGTAANDVWITGSQSSIYHFDGSSWTPARTPPLPAASVVRSAHAVNKDEGWAVGCDDGKCNDAATGFVLHYTGVNKDWTLAGSFQGGGLHRVYALDQGHVWIAGREAASERNVASGNWEPVRQKRKAIYNGLSATQPDGLWMAGAERTEDGKRSVGVLWHQAP